MGIFTIKLPDIGEGIAEAELVEWSVKIGDMVAEDDVLGAVMTDKATVEVPSSATGKVTWLGCDVGDTISIGAEFVRLEVDGEGNMDAPANDAAPAEEETSAPAVAEKPQEPAKEEPAAPPAKPAPATRSFQGSGPIRAEGEKPLAAPSVRLRAKQAGVDLRQVRGSGPAGRITHDDLDSFFQEDAKPAGRIGRVADTSINEVRVVGLRRKIAEKMALSKARIPHISIVEEVDMTALEELRASLNADHGQTKAKLTVLPFMIRAIVKAVKDQPAMNAHYDDENNVMRQYGGVHVGIAAQTPNGLVVPVVKHAEALGLWDSASELVRLADAARAGTAKREELGGSTITITSLGKLGALATTPIINHPEVAIVGINKMAVRPMWDGNQFIPRKMMNISCSFDHRVIDGWDAAVFVQKLKTLLETPAMIFVED